MRKKVLVLSSGDNHGAYEAAYRMAKFLKEASYEVALVVREKTKTDAFIIQVPLTHRHRPIIKRLVNKFIPEKIKPATDKEYLFLDEDESRDYVSAEHILDRLPFIPELILVGMIDGFGNTNLLSALKEKTKAKIYILTVDMFPYTGGCHYSWGCKGYENTCSNCPAILDNTQKDWAHKNLMIKLSNIKKANIQIMAGSGLTLEQAKSSTLFKSQQKIFNTNGLIDTRLFNNKNRMHAKGIFNIPVNAKIIFTGSWFTTDKRKGMIYFIESLNLLWQRLDDSQKDNTYVLIAGEHTADNELIARIPFKKHLIDYIKDYRLLSLAYQAADIFICASIEDSGPLMVSEALACGTPVVGFEMGVVTNMVVDGYNGFKAALKNSEELADGMYKILCLSDVEFNAFSENAVRQVEEFATSHRFVKIVEEILEEDE